MASTNKNTFLVTAISAVAGVLVAFLLVFGFSYFVRGVDNRDGNEGPSEEDNDLEVEEEVLSEVLFGWGVSTTTLYFVDRSSENENENVCDPVSPTTRDQTVETADELLDLLFAGPTLDENYNDLVTVIPQGVTVISFEITSGGQATVILSRAFYSSYCARSQAELQIKKTLETFPEIETVNVIVL